METEVFAKRMHVNEIITICIIDTKLNISFTYASDSIRLKEKKFHLIVLSFLIPQTLI